MKSQDVWLPSFKLKISEAFNRPRSLYAEERGYRLKRALLGFRAIGTQTLSRLAQAPGMYQYLVLGVLVILLNIDTLAVGFLTDDYWLLDSVVHRGIAFAGEWVQGLSYYRPVVMLTLGFNQRLFGTNPIGYHVFNVVIHLLNVLLLYLVSLHVVHILAKYRNFRQSLIFALPLLVSLFFCLHPANAHDVVWISGRTDLLAGFFITCVVLFFLKSVEDRRRNWPILSAIMFVLGLATKEIAFVLPFVLVAISVELALLKTQKRASFTEMWAHVSSGFRSCLLFFLIDIVYFILRLLMFHLNDPRANFGTVGLREVALFLARSVFLLFSPIDPLSALNISVAHPVFAIITALIGVVLVVSLLSPLRQYVRSNISQAFGVSMLGIASCIVPYLYSVSISQRLMYVPIQLMMILFVPIAAAIVGPKKEIGRHSLKIAVSCVFLMCLFAFFYRQNIVAWENASVLDKKLVGEIVAQTVDPQKPIIVIDYPQRVNQANILYFLPYRLHFAFYGEFGRSDNVYAGFCLVPPSFQEAGNGLVFTPSDTGLAVFVLQSKDPSQFFYPDPYGMKFEKGIPVREARPGQTVTNELLTVRVLDVNEVGRMIRAEARFNRPWVLKAGQVFVFRDGSMQRIQ